MNSPLNKTAGKLLSNSKLTRWKRMTGSSAVIGAAAATTASAGVVQITLPNEQVTGTAGGGTNTFTGDFTRDNVNDLPGWSANYNPGADARLYSTFTTVGFANTAGVRVGSNIVLGNPRSVSGLLPFVFTDSRINGGAATAAFLDVTATNAPNVWTVRAVRTVFDDSSITRPTGVVAGGTNKEFDPTVYALRTKFASKIKKLKKKAKAAARAGNAIKAKKLNKKVKKLNKKLAAIA